MPKIVTANMLSTGKVVFLDDRETWVSSVDEAKLFADSNAAEEGLLVGQRDAERSIIVDPFITDRDPAAALRSGMTLRDAIRAFGPTIKFGNGAVTNGAATNEKPL